MRSILRWVAIATLFIVPCKVGGQCKATTAASRGPLWATLSAGRGDLQVNCEVCRRNDQSSWAADVAVGGWLAQHAAMGGELAAWRLGNDDATQRILMISAISQLYPLSKATNAFVRFGVGLMSYKSTDAEQA